MSTERRSFSVTADAEQLRRELGPTVWFVFEAMLLETTDTSGMLTAQVSVRSLAERVGLSKNAVARAVARLRSAGLVMGRQSRSRSGTFIAGSYSLALPASIAVHAGRSARPCAARSSDDAQLTLAIDS